MQEAQRIAYLEALGITQYVALQPVAGAMQLPELDWPEVESPEPSEGLQSSEAASGPDPVRELQTSKPAVTRARITEPETTPLETADQGIPQLDLAKLGLQPESRPASDVSAKQTALGAFSCLVLAPDSRFRLLLELSAADAPGVSSLEHRMLSDLLFAVGVKEIPDQQGSRLYRWPVINNPRMAADPVAALDAISAFLTASETLSHTLVLGGQVARALGLAQGMEVQTLESLPGYFLAVPGFDALQADWRLKAQAWPQISAFLSQVI